MIEITTIETVSGTLIIAGIGYAVATLQYILNPTNQAKMLKLETDLLTLGKDVAEIKTNAPGAMVDTIATIEAIAADVAEMKKSAQPPAATTAAKP